MRALLQKACDSIPFQRMIPQPRREVRDTPIVIANYARVLAESLDSSEIGRQPKNPLEIEMASSALPLDAESATRLTPLGADRRRLRVSEGFQC